MDNANANTDNDFTQLCDLAAERLGGAVVHANDEFFAAKDNLVLLAPAVWKEGLYTDRGKWMDGWETRRRRDGGTFDFCIVRLGAPGLVRGVVVDTAFFRGNYPEACSIDAVALDGNPDVAALLVAPWTELLPRSPLAGDSKNKFAVAAKTRATHLRLNIFPDGGVARLRVHGEVLPDLRVIGRPGAELDLAAAENGGLVETASDMFFGSRENLIQPGRGTHMGDGWETKRRRGPGHDWVVVRLAGAAHIRRIEVDTAHFKGNAPDSCVLEGITPGGDVEILPRVRLQPHTRHVYLDEVQPHQPVTHVRLRIYPDGGVSRLRLWGTLAEEGRRALWLRYLNTLDAPAATAALLRCCGSSAWASKMAAARPFTDTGALHVAASETWAGLAAADWHDAFRAHPRIGERKASAWAAGEQAGAATATAATLAALDAANRAYEARFGHIFIVCATGKSAAEMLALCEARLANEPEAELAVAAAEQAKITALRLDKLLEGK